MKHLLRFLRFCGEGVPLLVFWLRWLLWDFSGLHFIYLKIFPPKPSEENPSTFFLWLIGIYIALFGVASQRYENRLDRIENRANGIFSQLGSGPKQALTRIPDAQRMKRPVKPELIDPKSVFCSFLCAQEPDEETVNALRNVVVSFKDDLSNIHLNGVNLQRTNLFGANLFGTSLMGADLSEADLSRSNLQRANLFRANLIRASLRKANLSGANLWQAYLQEADLSRTVGLTAGQVKRAFFWKLAFYDDDLIRELGLPTDHNERVKKKLAKLKKEQKHG